MPARAPPVVFQKNTAWHADGTSSKTEQYYTPELLARVRKAYRHGLRMLESIGALGAGTDDGRRVECFI